MNSSGDITMWVVPSRTYPLTGKTCVSYVVTDLAVLRWNKDRFVICESGTQQIGGNDVMHQYVCAQGVADQVFGIPGIAGNDHDAAAVIDSITESWFHRSVIDVEGGDS